MTKVHFVGDGERDARTLPHLVERLLGISIEPATFRWARLNGGGGYARKAVFAMISAVNHGADGIVMVVDRDRASAWTRLKELNIGRDGYRGNPSHKHLPTALGEANPHGEAWLLDDPVAVREALGLEHTVEIRSVLKTSDPKGHLAELIRLSEVVEMGPTEALSKISRRLDPNRCRHADETGFERFRDDLLGEFRALGNSAAR